MSGLSSGTKGSTLFGITGDNVEIPIKINLPDQDSVNPYGQALIDVVAASSGVRLKPGSEELADTSTGLKLDGIYNWEEQGLVICCSSGGVFKVSGSIAGFYDLLMEDGNGITLEDGSGTLLLESEATLTDVSNDYLVTGTRVIFANYGDYLYMANGNKIKELHPTASTVTAGGTVYTCILNNINVEPGVTSGWATYWSATGTAGDAWDSGTRYGSGNADDLEDADAPDTVTWIGLADKYLLALEKNSGRMWYSVVEEPWSWDSDWVSAEHLPDDTNCLRVYNGEVWVGGRRSIESFVDDGSTPWIKSSYGAINAGVLAPYTFLNVKGSFLFIDEKKRLVSLSGREAVSLNESLNTFLSDISVINDAIADLVAIDGIEYYILYFPTENRTIAINVDNWSWSEWKYYVSGYDYSWNITCITGVPGWDLVLAGDKDGKIDSVKSSLSTDNTVEIAGIIRSPRLQTSRTVRVAELMVGLTKVSKTTEEGDSSLSIKWRDDGGDWSNSLSLTVDSEETDHVLHFRRLGAYRHNRQYEIDCSDLWPYAIQRVDQI